jgi:agmatine deiminase
VSTICLFRLILIPSQPDGLTDHSDGMVRFLDESSILLNDYSKEPDREFVRSLKAALNNTGLIIIKVPTTIFDNQDKNDATGDYINYLQMNGYIFLPIFKRKGDEEAVKLSENLFQGYTIIPVESTQLSKDGGVMNCIS